MNKIKTYGLGVVALLIAIISLVSGHGTNNQRAGAVNNITTNLPSLGVNAIAIGPGCDQSYTSATCVGTGAATSAANFDLNGVLQNSSRVQLSAGTTTPCNILSPAATTSLEWVSMNLATATGTATTWTIATSTTVNSTSTALYTTSVASGQQATLIWYPSTTNSSATATSTGILPPSTYVVVGSAGGKDGPVNNEGTFASSSSATVAGSYCQASFLLMQ